MEGDGPQAPGGGPDRVVLVEQRQVDGSGQFGALAIEPVDLGVDAGEGGVALGRQLAPGAADLALLGGEIAHLPLSALKGLDGGELGVLEHRPASAELVELPLDGGQVPGVGRARRQALAQDGGAPRDLVDLVLAARGPLPGLGERPVCEGGRAPVGLEALDGVLDAGQDGQVLALVSQTGESGVEALEVDEQSLLAEGGARHGCGPSLLAEVWSSAGVRSRCSDAGSTGR